MMERIVLPPAVARLTEGLEKAYGCVDLTQAHGDAQHVLLLCYVNGIMRT